MSNGAGGRTDASPVRRPVSPDTARGARTGLHFGMQGATLNDLCIVRATWGGSGMTEARPDAAASASLWERDTEITAITEAIDEL